MRTEKEYILCAAILRKQESNAHHFYHEHLCDIYRCETGWRHPDILYRFKGIVSTNPYDQGFLTSKSRFVGRGEAARIAFEAGQIKEQKRTLFSEDLY